MEKILAAIRRVKLLEASRHLSSREALFLGFALIFALWLLSALDLLSRLEVARDRTSLLNQRYTVSERALTNIRMQVLLSSIYLRDALLDDSEGSVEQYRRLLEETRRAIERALDVYEPVVASAPELEGIDALRREINARWDVLLPVLDFDSPMRWSETQEFLRSRVMPRRDVIISISERILALNREGFEQQQAEVELLYSRLRRRVWEASGVALLLGLSVAGLVTRHISLLEARIHQQLLRDAENTRDLQRLSARLVRAQEEERSVIARELHDEIGQALTAVKVQLAVAERRLDVKAVEPHPLDETKQVVDHALRAVRDLSQLLHPRMLDDLGLPTALEWYLQGFSARTGVGADLNVDGWDGRLVSEIESCLYRIVQEALTNITRHARATHCSVSLNRGPELVALEVHDDGIGFDVEAVEAPGAGRGLGLLGIRERVTGFRGAFRIESRPGQGTTVIVELPALVAKETGATATDAPVVEEEPEEVRSGQAAYLVGG
jgi:signal transduction histidine kinase